MGGLRAASHQIFLDSGCGSAFAGDQSFDFDPSRHRAAIMAANALLAMTPAPSRLGLARAPAIRLIPIPIAMARKAACWIRSKFC